MAQRKLKKKKSAFARRRNRRITFMGVFFCLCLMGLFFRIGYIKYVKGAEYEIKAVKQQVTGKNNVEKETNPNRGYILDRNKQPLAVSSRVYTVVLDIIMLDSRKPNVADPTKDAKTVTLTTLSEALSIPMRELEALFAKDAEGNLIKQTYYHILATKVPSTVALPLEKLSDVYLEADTLRKYTDPTLAPQTIGFLRGDSSWGLENQYNEDLTGEQGRIFRTYDRDNNPVTEDIPPRDGYYIITTLDGGIQRIAQAAVEKAYNTIECQATSLLVMNPYTAEILAMAQWPSFSLAEPDNPAFFTDQRISSMWDALSKEEQLNQMYKVWGNYNITHSFEPGSIFKPVVVAAALEENIVDPATFSTFCNGKVKIYDREIPCHKKYGHGGQTLVEVLAHSCNLGMIDIINRIGPDIFYKYRCDFGFGEKTDIDLPGEASVSSPSVMYTLSQLNPVELATSSMGQGFNNTAIQAVTAFSAVINGGNVMKPYLVSQIVDEQYNVIKETTPTVVRKAISGETSDFMRYALQQVVTPEGTGWGAHIEGYAIGGKTGSGQQGIDRDQMTLTFMSFFPADNPEYVVLAIVDRPADIELTSSQSVSPMMRDVISEIIQYKNIPPSDESADINSVRNSIGDRSELKDYTGMQLTEVTHHLNNLNVDYQISGSGTVVASHIPAAGQTIPTNSPIFLYMDPETQYDDEMTVVPNVEGLTMEQAESYITEANLTPITFMPENETGDTGGGDPVTYNPLYSEAPPPEETAQETESYYVYKQYPSYGAYIQKGTEIKLKVKKKN